MFCTKCGAEVAEEYAFCRRCGGPVPEASSLPEPTHSREEDEPPSVSEPSLGTTDGAPPAPAPAPGMRRGTLATVALALSIVLGLGFALRYTVFDTEAPSPGDDEVKATYERWLEAVIASDWDSQYELQVPPQQRKDCPRTFFVDTTRAAYETYPDEMRALLEAYRNTTYRGQSMAGADRAIVLVENTATNEKSNLDFRRVEGQWYFYDQVLEDSPCNPRMSKG